MKIDRRSLLSAVGIGLPALLAGMPLLAANTGRAKVRDVEAFAVKGAVFVKVTADDGTAGWGEAGHSGGKLVRDVIEGEIKNLAIGEDVFAGQATWAKVYYEVDELGPGGLASQALAGVDCALWDLRGKLLQQPVWALLGGKVRDDFPVYGSFSRDLGDGKYMTPEQCAAKAAELVSEGFVAVKLRMAIREEGADPDPDPTMPCARAVRKAIGDNMPLYIDANNGYRAARAITVGRQLQDELGVTVFEEPCAMHHWGSAAQVSDALDLSVALGEHEYTPFAFRDMIRQAKPDLLNPDVSKLSGLTAGLHVAAMAFAEDLPISVHNARPTLLTAAHAHFIGFAPTATHPQEHPGRKRLQNLWDYFENQIQPEGGRLRVPDTAGLGLIVNEAAVRKAASA
jgi:L-alanine-DL-glutamate epimerase-like enolase superfamily enzyme